MKTLRVLTGAALAAAALCSAPVATARNISVDSRPFEQTGEQWSQTNVDLKNNGAVQGNLPFQLNFGDGAKTYDFRFSENGFIQFVAPGSTGAGGSPTGNYIAPFAADLAFADNAQLISTSFSSGLIDPTAPYILSEATVKAFKFTWLGMCPASDVGCQTPDYFQLILFDRGAGDFRLQFNYGLTFSSVDVFGDPTSLAGQQGYSLGSNVLALHTGPFNSNNPDYCFTGGVGSLCGTVTAVPEPEVVTMLAGGLALLGVAARRRRGAGVKRAR